MERIVQNTTALSNATVAAICGALVLASCGSAPEPQPKPLYGGWGFDAAGEG
jgi:hypothetical protein